MKNVRIYFQVVAIIFFATISIIILPQILNSTNNFLAGVSIPKNNVNVAGVQKYNITPSSLGILPPITSAKSILIKDLGCDCTLFEKNSKIRLPIASTTKIMTALVASEYFAANSNLTVKDAAGISGSTVNLSRGETLSFRSLLYGLLLNSGNDAAFAIAENYSGGVDSFVEAMNKKAKDLNLQNTHFDNPAGFDSNNHFSSAEDLAIIAEESLKNSQLARIFATKETEVLSLDKKFSHKLFNLNKLLSSVVGVLGIKTGTTSLAKENLVGLVERNEHRIITVVLGSDDRFRETTNLIEWTYQNFTWQ